MPWKMVFAPETEDHFKALTARQHSMVLDTIDRQLAHQPDTETRNRKPLRENPIAGWELRIGNLRVYYEIVGESASPKDEPTVNVLAIGVKRRNRVWIGGKEIDL